MKARRRGSGILAARATGAGRRARLDLALVQRGLVPSREQGARLVMAGQVRVDGAVVDKPGAQIGAGARIEVRGGPRFVSRGGDKLAHALDAFAIAPAGRVCLDVGASTGGFTDCLLQRGARRVFAVDVGTGQLDARLRADPRVTALERTNARALTPAILPEAPTLAVIDVSFISLRKVLPAVAAVLAPGGEVVALVKPQFEVGRGEVGKGGVVRDPARHREAILAVAATARALGLAARGVAPSPLKGPKGNREFFLHLSVGGPALADLEARVDRAVTEAPA